MHEEFGGHKDGKPVQRALGPEFGDDADARVDDDDETETPRPSRNRVISTSTIAAKMMPLNSVNTLAHTIC